MFRIVQLPSIAFVYYGMVSHINFSNSFQFSKVGLKRDVGITEIISLYDVNISNK